MCPVMGLRRIEHEIEIEAPVGVVWALTEAIEGWPDFTPTMTRIERLDDGPLAAGSRARVKQPWQREAVWTVTTIDPPTRFAWKRRMGPMTIVATHALVETGRGCTQTLTVEMTGFGSAVFGVLSGAQIYGSLGAENKSFRRRAEEIARQG